MDASVSISGQDTVSSSRKRIAWVCQVCQRECILVRTESRCLCGHRHKEHPPAQAWRCQALGCECAGFNYIVAEGSWVLKCRCKHRHTDHHPASRACTRAGCACAGFHSPWVCNCDHAWANHTQIEVTQRSQMSVEWAAADLNRWDLLRRGEQPEAPGGAPSGGA